jgi:methylmalonyl-CoA/ethylmalonyl-CoA epimerase
MIGDQMPKIHHFGYATKNIEATERFFLGLGISSVTELIDDHVLGVSVKFYKINGTDILLELVAPINSEKNPIISILQKRSGLYHIAFQSENFSETAKNLNLRPISERKPAKAFNGSFVQFFVAKDMSIIELIEYKDNASEL